MAVTTQLKDRDILFFNLKRSIIFVCCLFTEMCLIEAYSDLRHHAMVVMLKSHTQEAGGHKV